MGYWHVEDTGGLSGGDLWWFLGLSIARRWSEEQKPSYNYELSWLFHRDSGTIRKALLRLVELRLIEPNGTSGSRRLFKPTKKLLNYLTGKNGLTLEWEPEKN